MEENTICQLCSFTDIKGYSLVPLSGLDDLVIHLFQVDPEKKKHFLHPCNKVNITKKSINCGMRLKMSNIKSQGRHYTAD